MTIKGKNHNKTIQERIEGAKHRGSLYMILRDRHDLVIKEVSLTRDLQDELRAEFARQASAFEPSQMNVVPYRPFDGIDDGQLFELPVSSPDKDTDGHVALPKALHKALTSSDSAPVLKGSPDPTSVRALAWVVNAAKAEDALVVFQAMEKTQVLRNRFLLSIVRDDTYQRLVETPMVLQDRSHAVYVDGKLYFSKDYYVKRFIELSAVVEEATHDDVEGFYKLECFSAAHRPKAADADQWMRRKIASIRQQNTAIIPEAVRVAAKKFGIDVTIHGKGKAATIDLPSEKHALKELLRMLDEDYYESWRGNRFQAASKRRLGQP